MVAEDQRAASPDMSSGGNGAKEGEEGEEEGDDAVESPPAIARKCSGSEMPLPPWLDVVREVTGEKQFSSRFISSMEKCTEGVVQFPTLNVHA